MKQEIIFQLLSRKFSFLKEGPTGEGDQFELAILLIRLTCHSNAQ